MKNLTLFLKKNKTSFLVVANLVLFTLVYISCKKETDLTRSNSRVNSFQIPEYRNKNGLIPFSCYSDTLAIAPYNPNNPYDLVGRFHNIGINFVINNIDFSVYDSISYGLIKKVIDTTVTQGYINSTLTRGFYDTLSQIVFVSYINGTDPVDIINTGQISNLAYKYYRDSILGQFNGSYEVGNRASIQTIVTNLKNLENRIKSSIMLTNDEKRCLLAGTSVAKYSIMFWWCQYNTNPDFAHVISFYRDDWKFFINICRADVEGAVGGAIAGSLAGAGGALAGACGVGLGSSVGRGVGMMLFGGY